MYEYEYRLKVIVPNFECIKQILKSTNKEYIVKYIKCFRCKENNQWEMKKKLRQVMVFHNLSLNWIPFIESKEKSFNEWRTKDYKTFYESIAFFQNPFDIEHRYELQIDERAKLYGYRNNDNEFGLVFELETRCDRSRSTELQPTVTDLDSYCEQLNLFRDKVLPPYVLHKSVRKPVTLTKRKLDSALSAVKHDGVFGHVYSYQNYIFEEWEDGQRYLFDHESIANGFVFGAERLYEKVILLYVTQVRGLRVYNVHDVLRKFFFTISDFPMRYSFQKYYENGLPPIDTGISDGVIFHTADDKIYKNKFKNTIDLLYENTFFITEMGLIQCRESNLKNGLVYECDLDLNVIKPRLDRFVSNTPKQIDRILKISSRKLEYSLLFD